MPLHDFSAQPRAIHKAWPLAEISRIRKHSCCAAEFNAAKHATFKNWHENSMSSTCEALKEISFNHTSFKNKADNSGPCFWIVLPYLVGFNYGPVKSALTNVMLHWSNVLSRILKVKPNFRFSFKNAGSNLEVSLLACSRLKRGVEWSGGRR